MRLNQDRLDFVKQHLRRAGANARCDCDHSSMVINPELCELRGYNDALLLPGSSSCPMLTIYCAGCGNTRLYNAIILGLVDRNTGKLR